MRRRERAITRLAGPFNGASVPNASPRLPSECKGTRKPNTRFETYEAVPTRCAEVPGGSSEKPAQGRGVPLWGRGPNGGVAREGRNERRQGGQRRLVVALRPIIYIMYSIRCASPAPRLIRPSSCARSFPPPLIRKANLFRPLTACPCAPRPNHLPTPTVRAGHMRR